MFPLPIPPHPITPIVIRSEGAGRSTRPNALNAKRLGSATAAPVAARKPRRFIEEFFGDNAIVERMRFSAYVAFITLWSIVVYDPMA